MEIREACIKVHNLLIGDSSYVCYGTDQDEREVRVYYREYLGIPENVPESVGEFPVRLLTIASVRHHSLEIPS